MGVCFLLQQREFSGKQWSFLQTVKNDQPNSSFCPFLHALYTHIMHEEVKHLNISLKLVQVCCDEMESGLCFFVKATHTF